MQLAYVSSCSEHFDNGISNSSKLCSTTLDLCIFEIVYTVTRSCQINQQIQNCNNQITTAQ